MEIADIRRIISENYAVMASKPHRRGVRKFFELKERLEKVRTLGGLGRIDAEREDYFGGMREKDPELYVSFRVPDEKLIRKIREKMLEFKSTIILN